MWLKSPVYRGFKCEGKCFYPHTYPHTCFHTLTPSLFRQKASCLSGIQWVGVNSGFIGRIAMLYDEYRYVILLVYLCCTIGTRLLHYRYQAAALSVQGCCTSLLLTLSIDENVFYFCAFYEIFVE